MPEISRLFGIIIYMYHKDHAPSLFICKIWRNGSNVLYRNGRNNQRRFAQEPKRLVQAWIELHKEELFTNWNLLQQENAEFFKIKPLE